MPHRVEKHFFDGSFRLHIVPDASRGTAFGVGLMEELQRHGYRTSPGTLYPIRHALERNGYLIKRSAVGGQARTRGYGDTEVGIRWQLNEESQTVPMVGIFPLVEIYKQRGQGTWQWAQPDLSPIWLQKKWGDVQTYGGGGYWINNAPRTELLVRVAGAIPVF
jgi:hypothetical protein